MRARDKKQVVIDQPNLVEEVMTPMWKGTDGRLYSDERTARWVSCTHTRCECGNIMSRGWARCEVCRMKKYRDYYLKLEEKEWDGEIPVVTYDSDHYFFSEEDVELYLEDLNDNDGGDHTIDDLGLIICKPQYGSDYRLDEDFFCDLLHEDQELPVKLCDAIDQFNKRVANYKEPVSWIPGKYRVKKIGEKIC